MHDSIPGSAYHCTTQDFTMHTEYAHSLINPLQISVHNSSEETIGDSKDVGKESRKKLKLLGLFRPRRR